MMQRVFLSLACAAALSACSQPSGAPEAAARIWDFVNADSAAIFSGKLAKATQLLARATRVVPNSSGANLRAPDCVNPAGLFALDLPPVAPSRDLGLTGSETCAEAFQKLKARYPQALAVAALGARLLKDIKPGVLYCGMKVDSTPLDARTAAAALAFSAIDVPKNAHYRQTSFGASAETAVALQTHFDSGCDSAHGDCAKLLAPDLTAAAVTGTARADFDLAAKTASTTSRLRADYRYLATDDGKAGGSLSVAIVSTTTYAGLAEGGVPTAAETTKMTFSGSGPSGMAAAGDQNMTLTLTAAAAGKTSIEFSGNSIAGTGTPSEEPFALTFAAGATASCQTDLGLVDAPDESGGGPSEKPPFDGKALAGLWTSACVPGELGRFGAANFIETLKFSGLSPAASAGGFTHTLSIFDDRECATGHEVATLNLIGTFAARASATAVKDASLDYVYQILAVAPGTAGITANLNAATLCGRGDWSAGKAFEFAAGNCSFDLGTAALMNLATLQRQREFTTARRIDDSVVDFARTSHFSGDQANARAVVGGGEARRLKSATGLNN